ncbi:MAG: efflux RND transporter permease subunit, partial [bacterium]|nr:efflux RND transporter permease subunit [bacterium]
MVEAPQRKLVFEVDREKAALHGVPATQVVRSLRLALSGEDAGLLHLDEEVEPVTIRLELPRAERSSASDLGQVYLASMHQS